MSVTAAVIPQPAECVMTGSEVELASSAAISWAGKEAQGCAELLAEYLRPATGFPLPVVAAGKEPAAAIRLLQTAEAAPDDAGFCDEQYQLTVDKGVITISSPNGSGLARGLQTLRQLLPAEIFLSTPQSVRWTVPGVTISDRPRMRWRGLHLDVSRHFFSVAEVCRFIDLLALHRMNVFHWHLTDDQGWRVEIKQYPKLTEVGSRRSETLIGHHQNARPRRYDGTPHNGFYTQEDIRAIVAYAARRHVAIVPEIDMPGHMQAAISAYPELGNLAMPFPPRCHWGISQHILNAEESTVTFMKNVLDEVMELFPGRFIHIGGDEALKNEWSESKRVQDLMSERSLKDEHEMQSWFIRQITQHLIQRGRRCIGWDEILEGGLAEGAAVMSWRGEDGGVAAARQGHDVVFATNSHTYFDYYQDYPIEEEPLAIGGMTPTSKVYSYDPVPAALRGELEKHILGGQGQLWSEYIADRAKLDYMTYPRACALAEILWLPAEQKNYADFRRRLSAHRARLAALEVNACPVP